MGRIPQGQTHKSLNGAKNLDLGDIWVLSLLHPPQWVLTSMALWFCEARRGGTPETGLPLPCISCTPIRPEDGLQELSPLSNSKPRILCLAAPDTASVASCGPRAWHLFKGELSKYQLSQCPTYRQKSDLRLL